MPLNTAFFPRLLISLSIDILAVCLIDKQCFTGKQNLNYKIYWEKKIDEQDWVQFFCNEFPPKLHLPFEQVKNTIQYSNSEIYQPQAIEHDFLSMLSNILNKIHLK